MTYAISPCREGVAFRAWAGNWHLATTINQMAALWRELRRGASTSVVRDRMFGTGDEAIEPGHMDVLDLLHRDEPRRMNDLAAALRVDPSTVTRAIQRMEADGLVRRVPADGDGRGIDVTATEKGTPASRGRRRPSVRHRRARHGPLDRRGTRARSSPCSTASSPRSTTTSATARRSARRGPERGRPARVAARG